MCNYGSVYSTQIVLQSFTRAPNRNSTCDKCEDQILLKNSFSCQKVGLHNL